MVFEVSPFFLRYRPNQYQWGAWWLLLSITDFVVTLALLHPDSGYKEWTPDAWRVWNWFFFLAFVFLGIGFVGFQLSFRNVVRVEGF